MKDQQRNSFTQKKLQESINILIPRGGSSVVKKGIRKSDGQVFAIKIIDKDNLNDDEQNCLKNELKILGIVNHPNVVRVFEYFETNECIFIVMEVMVGGEVII